MASGSSHTRATVQCDCGKVTDKNWHRILAGNTRTCGCKLKYSLAPNIGITELPADIENSLVRALYSEKKSELKRRFKSQNFQAGFEITLQEFKALSLAPCASCGDIGSNYRTLMRRGQRYTILFNGLDRKDSKKGYIQQNLQTLCGVCNQMKLDQSPTDLIRRAKGIVKLGERMLDPEYQSKEVMIPKEKSLFSITDKIHSKKGRTYKKRGAGIEEVLDKRFTYLTVVARTLGSTFRSPKVTVQCDCGTIRDAEVHSLLGGHLRTCGTCDLRYKLPPNIGTVGFPDEIKRKLIKSCYSSFKSHKRQKNSGFSLKLEEFAILIQRPCESCEDVGTSFLTRLIRGKKYTLLYNGLDQIIPKQGYHLNNVQNLCKYCNKLKRDQTSEEMIRRAKGLIKLGEKLIEEKSINDK